MVRRKFAASLAAECSARGLHEPPPELARAYAEAVGAMLQAVRERRRAAEFEQRRLWFGEFRTAVATMLAVRRSLGLATEQRTYTGVRAARAAAAQSLPEDSLYAPLPVPPRVAGGKPN